MDTDHFVRLRSVLAAMPSRRAVARGLAGLAAGSVLAPLIGFASVEAKKKKGRKKKQKNKNKNQQMCKAFGYVYCPRVGAPNDCCSAQGAICTQCGCCTNDFPNCCLGGIERTCCANDETCCLGPNGEASCCEPGSICCDGRCCAPAFSAQCCGGVNCCHRVETCCPDGSCQLVCR